MLDHSFEDIKLVALERLAHLKADLTYHCLDHTLDVLEQSQRIAAEEGVSDSAQIELLKIAALYHDAGFLRTYSKHEEKSAEIFLQDAPNFNLSPEDRDQIVRLIMVTQIPQRPQDLLERIICDADLDYLGRDDFFTIGDNLRKEFLAYKIVGSDEDWYALQLKFLQNHQYHTASSQLSREPKKQENYASLL